jgi:hypothetical protein
LRTLDAHSDNEGTSLWGGDSVFLGATIYLDYIETICIKLNVDFRLSAPGVEACFFAFFWGKKFEREV